MTIADIFMCMAVGAILVILIWGSLHRRAGVTRQSINDASVTLRLPRGFTVNNSVIQPTMHQLSDALHSKQIHTARSNNGSSLGS